MPTLDDEFLALTGQPGTAALRPGGCDPYADYATASD